MSKRVVVTGSAGFAGRHMCRYLARIEPRLSVIGVDTQRCEIDGCTAVHQIDLTSAKETTSFIKEAQPDYIIHLAGTFGGGDPHLMFRVNVLSITTLLEAARNYAPDVVIVTAGSAAEYGRIGPDDLPVTEELPPRPISPYGLSKQLATQVARYYHRVHNISVMTIRPFQLIGKGVSRQLAPGAFAEQIKQAIAGGTKIIKVGNLESSRDFLDVNDAAEAIWLLCQRPAAGEVFNVCSGEPTTMADLLKMMIACCAVDVKVEVDPARIRGKRDVAAVYGSYDKLKAHCGWQPQTTLEQSVAAMFDG